MEHLHKRSGLTFEVSKYELDDITIITHWVMSANDGTYSPRFVDYYWGDYDKSATDSYIDKYLAAQWREYEQLTVAAKYLDAYLLTNSDVMERKEINELERSLRYVKNRLDDICPVANSDWKKAEGIKQILMHCMETHGAKITITVEHDDGTSATADLYDHAALTQSLYDSLDYFQSEL